MKNSLLILNCLALYPVHQPALLNDRANKFRERSGMISFPARQIPDGAARQIRFQDITCLDLIRFVQFDDRQTDIDGIPVKNTREGLRDDERHATALDRYRRVLPRRTAPKIIAGHNDIAGLHFFWEIMVQNLHAMRPQLFGIDRIQIPSRNNIVGIDVIAEFKNSAFNIHV